VASAAITGIAFVVSSVALHRRDARRHHIRAGGHFCVLSP
jgi:hypothetical protein